MTEQLINYVASLVNVPEWGGLDVDGFANLLLVMFVLVIVAETLMAIYDRTRKAKKGAKDRLTQATPERIENTRASIILE
jgi:hypothetical protein